MLDTFYPAGICFAHSADPGGLVSNQHLSLVGFCGTLLVLVCSTVDMAQTTDRKQIWERGWINKTPYSISVSSGSPDAEKELIAPVDRRTLLKPLITFETGREDWLTGFTVKLKNLSGKGIVHANVA